MAADRLPPSERGRLARPSEPSRAPPMVLLVDDDEAILQTASAILSDGGAFDVLLARSGLEALHALRAGRVDVVCTDYRMPGMSGLDLGLAVQQTWPDVSIVLMTGFRDYLAREQQALEGVTVLFKPYSPRDLLSAVEHAAQATRLRRSTDRLASALDSVPPSKRR